MILVILLLIVFLVPLCARLQRDFFSGLAYATGLLVCLPTALRIQLPGSLPDVTIHRLVLVCLLFFWLCNRSLWHSPSRTPMFRWFIFWGATHLLATVFTEIGFGTSLKRFLDFALEVFLFYVVVATTVREPGQALRLLRAVWAALLVVAFFAFIEKYSGFNPVDRFIPDYAREGSARWDVNSTYPHRILLGAAMAMAWPLAFALMFADESKAWVSRRWLWVSVIAFLSSCYFAMSRGPWLGSILAAGLLAALGSAQLRRRLMILGALAVLTFIVRPGVWGSMSSLAEATTQADTQKSGSFKYRIELWKIAWAEVSQSPLRMLVGCGPGVGSEMDLDWEISWRGKERKIESWDNHYAYDLYQAGLLGLAATFGLYGAALLSLYRVRSGADDSGKTIMGCLLASAMVFIFMMTNALIFAKQLNFLFWTVIAVGMVLVPKKKLIPTQEASPTDPDSSASEPGLLPHVSPEPEKVW